MSFLQSFGVVLLILAAIGLVLWLGNKGYFNKAKATYKGTELKFDESNWRKYAPYGAGVIFLIIIAFLISGCSSSDDPPAVAQPQMCPVVIEATLGASPYEDRVKALAIEAEGKGIQITGDYATDVRNQGGEMTLLGYNTTLTFDGNCRVVMAESHGNLFGHDYPIREGGFIEPDGKFKDLYINVEGALVTITGQLVDRQLVGGEVHKSWLWHIFGRLENIVIRFI